MGDNAENFEQLIEGWTTVRNWFGRSPNFHDSEITKLELTRAPEPSELHIHAWNVDYSKTDDDGCFERSNHAIIKLLLFGISSMNIEGWNNQNVLDGLRVERCGSTLIMHIDASYGVDGEFVCERIEASLSPIDLKV